MVQEMKEAGDKGAAEFKNQVFFHAIANQNPELFAKLYVDDEEEQQEVDYDSWEVPRSPEELNQMLQEFKVGRIS